MVGSSSGKNSPIIIALWILALSIMNVHLVMMFFQRNFAIKRIKKSRYFLASTGSDIGPENKTSSRVIAVI